jgi:hypothetical protein
VRLLLADMRVDPSARNNWAVSWAAENGHLEVVRLLLADERALLLLTVGLFVGQL